MSNHSIFLKYKCAKQTEFIKTFTTKAKLTANYLNTLLCKLVTLMSGLTRVSSYVSYPSHVKLI